MFSSAGYRPPSSKPTGRMSQASTSVPSGDVAVKGSGPARARLPVKELPKSVRRRSSPSTCTYSSGSSLGVVTV